MQVNGHYVVSADDGNAYLAAGLAGMGVLWLPRYMADPHVAHGELLRLFGDWPIEPMPMYLAYPPNRSVSPRLRAFTGWIDQLMCIASRLAVSVPTTSWLQRALFSVANYSSHGSEAAASCRCAGVALRSLAEGGMLAYVGLASCCQGLV